METIELADSAERKMNNPIRAFRSLTVRVAPG
jgi:hypothetical protein